MEQLNNPMSITHPKFAIVDIETTGGIARRDKITEIGIIVFQNGNVLDQYSTLIHPERSIPPEITRITGITNDMIENAPKFYEVAKEIVTKLQDCIFVAHNVHFDYNFIREEFHQLGFSFNAKKLCTLQLSRRLFKGLRSYSLGSLIQHFNIQVEARHRAMDDCQATLQLFKEILQAQGDVQSLGKSVLPQLVKENKLPPQISLEMVDQLPELPGVYFMLDQSFQPVYIGKSKNIKERIGQHFNASGPKVQKMLTKVHYLDHQLTGSDIMASLVEAELIKKHQPEINRALRKKSHAFLLVAQKDPLSFNRFQITEAEWLDNQDEVINHYASRLAAKQHVDYLILMHQLCNVINTSKVNGSPCSAYNIGQCLGACIGKEDPVSYNQRFRHACDEINSIFQDDFLLLTDGVTADQKGAILVENGFCRYIGFLSLDDNYYQLEQIKEQLRPYEGNVETNRIIRTAIKKDPTIKKIQIGELK